MPTALPYDNSLDGLERNIKYVVERLERVEQRLGITPPPPQPAEPDDDRNWVARSWRPPQAAQSEPPPAAPVTPPGQQPDERGWVTLPELTPQPTQPQPKPSVIGPVTPLPPTPVTPPPVTPPVAAASAAPLPDIMRIPDPTTAEPQPVVAAPFTPAPPPPPVAPPTPRVPAGRDWENLIGGKWALWVGLFSLFLAIASFLAYTWKSLPPLPPEGRLALGIGAGIVMLGAGSFFRSRAQRWFSEGLLGGGLAVLYLSIWIGAQQYHLLSFNVAFSSMALVTALGVYLAVRNNALSLSLLATSGGFLTPLMLSSGAGAASGSMSLLTYLGVLNAGILTVSLFKRWNSLSWLSFCGTVLLVVGWADGNYNPAALWTVFACITLYFLMYMATACFYSLVRREETSASDLLLLLASTAMYSLGGYMLLVGAAIAYPVFFVLALALLFGLLARAVATFAPANIALQRTAAGIALLMITLAFPVHFNGAVLAVSWCVEAALLLILGMRLRSRLLQAAGHWVWGLALLGVMSAFDQTPGTSGWLFINERALPLLVSMGTTALVLAQHWAIVRQRPDALQDDAPASPDVAARPVLTDSFAPLYAIYAVGAGAWLLAQETYLWFELTQRSTLAHWQLGANYAIAAVLATYAVATFAIGVRARDGVVRQTALAVLALAACIPLAMPLWTGLSAKTPDWPPFWNLRVLSYLVVSLMLGLNGWLISRKRAELGAGELSWMGVWPVAAAGFALLGATLELYGGFETLWHGPQWEKNAFFAIAVLWSVSAAVMAQIAYACRLTEMRAVAITLGWVGALTALLVSLDYNGQELALFFNLRSVAIATIALLLLVLALGEKRFAGTEDTEDSSAWPPSTVACGLLGSLMLLWGATQESYTAFAHYQLALGTHWKMQAAFFSSVLWSVGMLALLGVGLRWKQVAFRVAASLLFVLASGNLLFTALDADRLDWSPLLNARFLAFVFSTALWGVAAVLLHRAKDRIALSEQPWIGVYGWTAGVALWASVSLESYRIFEHYQLSLGSHWKLLAGFFLSALWGIVMQGLLQAGLSRKLVSLRTAAYTLFLLTGALLLFTTLEAIRLGWTPLLNARFASFMLLSGISAAAALQLHRNADRVEPWEVEWSNFFGCLAGAMLLWGITQEVYESCYFYREALGSYWTRWAQMFISVAWSVYGTALLIAGINRNFKPLRLAALGLLCCTVFKVFLFDLGFLSGPIRMFSLAGLGLALIFISWLYSRYGKGESEEG